MKNLVLLCVLSSGGTAWAEDQFLRELAVTRNFNLGRPAKAEPTPDGAAVLFLRTEARSPVTSLYSFDVASGQAKVLITPEQILKGADEKLSQAEKSQRERQRISTRGFTSYQLSDDGKLILAVLSGKLYVIRRADNDVTELKTGTLPPLNPTWSPDATRIAYVHDRDLYVYDLKSKRETRLTRSTDPAISNGLAEFVAQEEMARVQGFWWAPDGRSLAYEEADDHGVEQLAIPDVAHPERPPEMMWYPRPGKANAKVRVGLISVAGGATTWVQWDREKLPYLARVVWRDQAPLSLVVMSRDEKTVQLLAAEKNGKTRVLVDEHDDAWIDLDREMPAWLPDGKGFLWSTEAAGGWPTLQLRGADGHLVRALSTEKENYRAFVHLDAAHRVAWFEGSPTAPESQVYRVALDAGAPVAMTRGLGLHYGDFARKNDRVWIETATSPTEMRHLVVHVADGGGDRVAGELPSVAVKPPFMSHATMERVGNLGFWTTTVRPRNFDPKRKYPVVVDTYAGPTVQLVRAAPMLMQQWMADHGVIVVSFDGRGTPGRGHDWARYIAGDFSRTIDDQAAALQALAGKHPEMDLSRVGITGWSFGGYESALAVEKRGDVFHVAVAGAPVVDWRDYDTHYTEHYLGLLPENKAAYDASSLLSYADRLQRPLLIVHGTSDDNVYFFNTLKLTDALFRAGKAFSLLPLNGFTHMVPDPVVKEELETRLMKFLTDVLFAPSPPKPLAKATERASR
ncbi:MAG TPA: DPP IV N-terminal domain-containing protein [Polyangia bacterium]|nr:DPP IV N-terminal domain-containing protein [Polyangia bacterium]